MWCAAVAMYNVVEALQSKWPHAERLLWEDGSEVHQRLYCVSFIKQRLTWRLVVLKTFSHVPQKVQRPDQ